MKRVIALLLVLTMALSLCACGEKQRSAIGTWYLFLLGEESEIYLTLKKDGTAIFEETEDGDIDSWEENYILVDGIDDLQDEDFDAFYCCYVPDSDQLVVRFDGYTLHMERVE